MNGDSVTHPTGQHWEHLASPFYEQILIELRLLFS